MKELRQILLQHAQKYPAMQPQDAVKLIYQNEFGSGHMIQNAAACLSRLHDEFNATPRDPSLPLCEYIGNKIYRVNLASIPLEDLDALGEAFLRTGAEYHGNPQHFLEKLSVLAELSKNGVFSFSYFQLEAYLADYQQAGFPAVSHSRAYRDAYHPAYRVIRK